MMSIEYKRLSPDRADEFIALRIAQLREEGAREDIDLAPALKSYYERHMKDDTFIAWTALDGGSIVATGGISIVEKPPYFSCPTGRIALLSSMYTDARYRRQGIARHILSLLADEARERECGVIQITASDMGVKLYSAYGFEKNENFMQLKL